MRLSEREKKYVILLAVLLLLASFYFYYTLLIEPYFAQRDTLISQKEQLLEQEHIVNTKISGLNELRSQVEAKMNEAMVVTSSFYPSLPQDRLLVLLQDLIDKSGLSVKTIGFAEPVLQSLNQSAASTAVPSYQLKVLSDSIKGIEPPVEESTPDSAEAEIDRQMIPMLTVSLSYDGLYDQVVQFVKSIEALGRTVTVDNLDVGNSETNVVTGSLTMNFFAIDKPAEDPFMEWTVTGSFGDATLFQRVYINPGNSTDNEAERP